MKILFIFLYVSSIYAKDPLWSILIPTLNERKEVFDRVYSSLMQQIYTSGLQDEIEIIVSCDNRQ